jgi:lysophospholipase L1-like esterase
LEDLLAVTVINAGVPGELSKNGVKRLSTLLETTHPDLVILCHGGNDILKKYPQQQLESNLRKMIETTQSFGAELILVGVPKPAINLKALAVYEQLSEEYGVVSDNKILSELLENPALQSDRVHLNAKGYKELAVEISMRIEVRFD